MKKQEKMRDSLVMVLVAKQMPGMENYIIRTDSIRFKYLEQYGFDKNATLKYSIFDIKNNKVAGFGSQDGIVKYLGVNDYSLDFSSQGLLLKNGTYVLVVENIKGEKWYIRFTLSR